MVTGVSHMTFVVKDLERAAAFWKSVFSAKEVYSSGDRTFSVAREKFLLANGLWICLMEGEPGSERSYNHVAFQVPENELDLYEERIKSAGAEVKPGRSRIDGEGRSVYFYDFDNHLFELHTGTLEERLSLYCGN